MHVDAFRVIRRIHIGGERAAAPRTDLSGVLRRDHGRVVVDFSPDGRRSNTSYFAIHFAIIALSLAHIIWVRRFNLGLSFSFFSLFFFGVIPLFEYRLGVTYQGAATPEDSSYMASASLALMSAVCFYLGYGLTRGRRFSLDLLIKVRMVSVRHRQIAFVAICLTIFVLALCICGFFQFNVYKILLRGYGEEAEQSALAYSLINYITRPLIFNLIFLTALIVSRRQHVPWLKIMGLCPWRLAQHEVGVPRSLAGALWVPRW